MKPSCSQSRPNKGFQARRLNPGVGPHGNSVKRVLFVCGRNRLRSPTAEQLFGARSDIEVASAGLNPDADTPLSADQVEWADLIFVMEKAHKAKLSTRFRANLKGKRVVCLDIPDNYSFMEPALVKLLNAKVPRFLGAS
jgi:predicted protein tyrosine phosphatase